MLSSVECGGLIRDEMFLGVVFSVRIGPDVYGIHFLTVRVTSLYCGLLNDAYYIKCSAELV